MSVLCEVNIADERTKWGVKAEEVEELVRSISPLRHIRVMGLMTMGPYSEDPERLRPYFKKMREIFEKMKKYSEDPERLRPYFKKMREIFEKIKKMDIPNVEMRYLSMGMSDSYYIAIEEGANIVRIGTKIFGPRRYK